MSHCCTQALQSCVLDLIVTKPAIGKAGYGKAVPLLTNISTVPNAVRRPARRLDYVVPQTDYPPFISGVSATIWRTFVAQIGCPGLGIVCRDRLLASMFWLTSCPTFEVHQSQEDPQLTFFEKVEIYFFSTACTTLQVYHENHSGIAICISFEDLEFPLSRIFHRFSQLSAELSDVRRLLIDLLGRHASRLKPSGPLVNQISPTEWVQLVHPFTTMQTLCVCGVLGREHCSCTRRRCQGDGHRCAVSP